MTNSQYKRGLVAFPRHRFAFQQYRKRRSVNAAAVKDVTTTDERLLRVNNAPQYSTLARVRLSRAPAHTAVGSPLASRQLRVHMCLRWL